MDEFEVDDDYFLLEEAIHDRLQEDGGFSYDSETADLRGGYS